ncbi:MAG TPA: winged helix-turn-helix transcriptional regulator [Candidatus Methylomirabilis sp.]|nr:winged helix-turn-helix transcriptional regulator [Candidatus Methylomirabilis sp.]
MKGYGQFCPVAVACEIFAERWTPLILRELFTGSRRFNEIRSGMPLISRTLLAQRLHQLEDAGVIESTPLRTGRGREYRLTKAGTEFREVVERLGEWGQRHAAQQFARDNLDPKLLMWAMHRRIDVSHLPAPRVVVRFELRGVTSRSQRTWTSWLVLERSGVDVCMKDPGFAVDMTVHADMGVFARVWTGHLPWADAVRSGHIKLEGPRALVQAFPGWLQLSHFARVLQPARAHAS